MDNKAKNIFYLALYRKHCPTPDLDQYFNKATLTLKNVFKLPQIMGVYYEATIS